jgi:CheY-like chemotaxis protein
LTLQAGLAKLPSCEVAMATDGAQALHLCEQQPFDLVVTDYKMPGMSGIQLAEEIKQKRPATAVLMVTAYGSDTLREEAARSGIARVLDKPVTLAEIRKVAAEVLGRLTLPDASAAPPAATPASP